VKPQFGLIAITGALIIYLVLIGRHGITLIQSGDTAAAAMGVSVLVLPVLGLWVIYTSFRAGFQHQHLARRIHEEGRELDLSEAPRMPSGRIERSAADAIFEQVRRETEAHPDDWRNYYRLARAYDIAGDRRRARETMKRAVELEAAERSEK
jgi:hypothetical protein